MGGEQFGRKEYVSECLQMKCKNEEQSGKEPLSYLGYWGHGADVIVTEPIEVSREAVNLAEKSVDLDSNIKELDEESQWVLSTKRYERVMTANKKKKRN